MSFYPLPVPPGNGGPGIHGQSVSMRGENLVLSGGVGKDFGSLFHFQPVPSEGPFRFSVQGSDIASFF